MNNKLSIKVLKKIDFELEKEWKKFEENGSFHFFQKLDIIKEYVRLNSINYFFVLIYLDNKVIAILPLEIYKLFGIKMLQWIGTKEFDYCCPLISNFEKLNINKEKFSHLWKEILNKIDDFDLIWFNKQPKNIFDVNNPFVIFLDNNDFNEVYSVNLPNDMNEYLDKIQNRKFISEFLRTKKKLMSENKVSFEILDKKDTKVYPSNLISHKASILDKKNIKHFLNEKLMNFYDNLYTNNPNSFQLSVLKIDNEIIALNLGLILKNRFYYFFPTIFSEKFNKFSPGKILIFNLIEWCISNKIKIFDFGLGDENYKKYWSNNSNSLFRHVQFRSLKGFFCFIFLKIYLFIKKF